MSKPSVSVVIETITTRFDRATGSLADDLRPTLDGLDRQTYPQELIERIVVLDEDIVADDAHELRTRYPALKYVTSPASNYFAAKNAGASVATGELIAMLDGDCEPASDWLEALVAAFQPGVAAVAGRTRYTGSSWSAWTFSIPDFAYVLGDDRRAASGFNINNVAFRREVLLAHPFDARIRRNGGCYLLFHQLRAAGECVLYEPRAVVAHGLTAGGLGFIRTHLNRGYDGVAVYRLDDSCVLRGTRLFRRLGALALLAITGRRIFVDWLRLLRHRHQIGIPAIALPYFWTIAVTMRLIEFTGGLTAIIASRSSR
jgi:glycosyltransferase involved in cell wall biosynthesis